MRLLQVTHQYLPAIGGSETFLAEISRELVTRGHHVDVVTTRSKSVLTWTSQLPHRETLDGVEIFRYWAVPRGRLGWHALRWGSAGTVATRSRWREWVMLVGLGPIVPGLLLYLLRKGRSYDLIHAQTLPYWTLVSATWCARLLGVPIVVTPHLHVEQPEQFDFSIYDRALHRADLILADSAIEANHLILRGLSPIRVKQMFVAISEDFAPTRTAAESRKRLSLPQNAFIVLFLGRKVAYKGLDLLVEACRSLAFEHRNLLLVAAGPRTPHSEMLRGRYASLDCWLDLDEVGDTERLDLLNACDLLALPSTGEAFGIVFLEAWACGKPVVGAKAGAIPDVIEDGIDGLLVEPGDIDALSDAIRRIVLEPATAQAMASAGREKVRTRFSLARLVDTLESSFADLITGD